MEVEGAMSYAMVWLNGTLVGGWPYGYNSWQLDLTPHIRYGEENQLAIRLDNPNHSAMVSRCRNLQKCMADQNAPGTHFSMGTYVTTKEVSASSATVNLELTVDNDSRQLPLLLSQLTSTSWTASG